MSIYYRTKDGLADYEFSFERQANGKYRVYIVGQPSYGGWAESLDKTHRLPDGSRYYVCWTGDLMTDADCRYVASTWADHTQNYRKYGTF